MEPIWFAATQKKAARHRAGRLPQADSWKLVADS
jgi:hypothetical protein